MKYYIEELADHLKAVLKMRQRIKDRVFRCKQLASNYAKVFGELSQIEVSVNDEISALKNAYVEAAGEIETHVRSFNRYNERGTFLICCFRFENTVESHLTVIQLRRNTSFWGSFC